VFGAGKCFLKSMIAGNDGRCARDLLVALFDQPNENPGAGAEARFDLRKCMLSVGVPDKEIGRALQKRQERDQEKEQPIPESAETEFQG
jgi:hypothetical protein